MNPLLAPTKTLWKLGHWRCDVDRRNRLRLFHHDTLVAEHTVASPESVQTYAQVWQAAIADIAEPQNGASDAASW